MQTYALGKAIESLGHDCRIINYINPRFEQLYRPKPLSIRNYIVYLRHPAHISFLKLFHDARKRYLLKRMNRHFERFRALCSTLTNPVRSVSEVEAMGFDAVICGSDQIWNPDIVGDVTDLYFAAIEGTRRIAYAASGIFPYASQSQTEQALAYIAQLNAVSVREQNMLSYFQSHGMQRVQLVLDPTMLLPKDYWLEIACKPNRTKHYLFAYLMWSDHSVLQRVHEIESSTKLPLYILNRFATKAVSGTDHLWAREPREFLRLLLDAECVVVNSFHGTVFSILFHKPFLAFDSGDRIRGLLSMLGLEDRLISFTHIVDKNMMDPIDWDAVDARIAEKRNSSWDFIKESLSSD